MADPVERRLPALSWRGTADPGLQVSCRWKRRHVEADPGGMIPAPTDARNLHQECPGRQKGAQNAVLTQSLRIACRF